MSGDDIKKAIEELRAKHRELDLRIAALRAKQGQLDSLLADIKRMIENAKRK